MLKFILAGLVLASSMVLAVGPMEYLHPKVSRTQADGLREFEFRLAHALATGDPKKIAELFLENGVDMPPNKPPIRGRTAIELDRKGRGERRSGGMRLSPLQTISGERLAVQVGFYQESVTLEDGSSKDDSAKYIFILQTDDQGQWKIAYAIYNSNLRALDIWR